MLYAARLDMVQRYSEQALIALTDQTGTGVVDEVALSAAMTQADAEIDSYLAGRYQLPLASVPEVLINKACVIARYLIDGQNGNEIVRDRYRDAVSWLRDVAAGRANLGLDINQAQQAPASSANIQSSGRIFDRASRE